MFEFLSWGHLLVIGLAALFIFGPERLPTLAADAGRGLRRLRETMSAVREQMSAEFGEDLPELRNLDVRHYHPRAFLRDQLFGDEDDLGATSVTAQRSTTDHGADRRPAGAAESRVQPPPFDVDAT